MLLLFRSIVALCECANCTFTSSFLVFVRSFSQCQLDWCAMCTSMMCAHERKCYHQYLCIARADETECDKIECLCLIHVTRHLCTRHFHSHINTLLNYSIAFTWTRVYCLFFFIAFYGIIIHITARISSQFYANAHQNDWMAGVNYFLENIYINPLNWGHVDANIVEQWNTWKFNDWNWAKCQNDCLCLWYEVIENMTIACHAE